MRKVILSLFIISMSIVTTGAGYVGTLPDLEADFAYLRTRTPEKAQSPYSVKELDKINEEKLKPIPREDDTYVDIIVKKDKTTKYVKDINGVIVVLEKLRKCLNTNQDIQMFNAIVSNLIDNVAYIHAEYKGKPEENYLSYNRLAYMSSHARDVANFRTQGYAQQKYKPYSAEENVYTKENLDQKLDELLQNVNETLFILKNLE